VREDAIQLFGFSSALEQQLFEKLIGVSGIGPKVALAVLSGIESPELVRAIRASDLARLTRIPGVGRKTAERIVVELRDRVPQDAAAAAAAEAGVSGDLREDLLSALANLGYQPAAVEKTVDNVLRADPARSFEDALRAVLKALVGSR
jgi:Holliday junction DNA helicase RuvA